MLLPALALAKTAKPAKSVQELEHVLKSYREAPAITAKVQKTVANEFMGNEKISKGMFYFAKGKMRMDIQPPEHSTVVYDGKHIWLESRVENNIEVLKVRSNKLKKTDSLLAALFEQKDVLRGFKHLKTEGKGSEKTYSFVPKKKGSSEVSALQVSIKSKQLTKISYTDQMENKVTLDFSDVKHGKVSSDKFAYHPPKGARITEE